MDSPFAARSCVVGGSLSVGRGLAAMLAADVLGYSRFMGADEADTALKLNPNHANILMTCAYVAVVRGDPEMAINHIQRARQLNPYMPGFDLCTLGSTCFQAKRYREAIDLISEVADPPSWS